MLLQEAVGLLSSGRGRCHQSATAQPPGRERPAQARRCSALIPPLASRSRSLSSITCASTASSARMIASIRITLVVLDVLLVVVADSRRKSLLLLSSSVLLSLLE